MQPTSSARASESLTRRDLRDILTRLISLIRKPFKYQVRPVSGPWINGPSLFVEGEKFNVQRIYRSMPIKSLEQCHRALTIFRRGLRVFNSAGAPAHPAHAGK